MIHLAFTKADHPVVVASAPSTLHGRAAWRGCRALTMEERKLDDLVCEALHLLASILRRIHGDLADRILVLALLRLVYRHPISRLRHSGGVYSLQFLHAILHHLVAEAPVVQQWRR